MARKQKYNEAQVKEIISMYKGKKSVKEIAQSLKTTPATIVSYLKKAKVYKGRKNKKRAGKKIKTGRKTMKLSLETISNRLKEARAEVKRQEKLLKKAIKQKEKDLKKFKKNAGVK